MASMALFEPHAAVLCCYSQQEQYVDMAALQPVWNMTIVLFASTALRPSWAAACFLFCLWWYIITIMMYVAPCCTTDHDASNFVSYGHQACAKGASCDGVGFCCVLPELAVAN